MTPETATLLSIGGLGLVRTLRDVGIDLATIRRVLERDPHEMQTMHRPARLSDDERQRIVAEFLDEAFAGLDIERGSETRACDPCGPGLPDNPTLDTIVPAFAGPDDDPADPDWRAGLADRLAQGTDTRAERYWQLLATINGWPPVPTLVPAWEWLIAALRASRG